MPTCSRCRRPINTWTTGRWVLPTTGGVETVCVPCTRAAARLAASLECGTVTLIDTDGREYNGRLMYHRRSRIAHRPLGRVMRLHHWRYTTYQAAMAELETARADSRTLRFETAYFVAAVERACELGGGGLHAIGKALAAWNKKPALPSYVLVPIEDLRAAELCELAARRLRRDDLSALTIAEAAAVEVIARCAIDAERETRSGQ